MYAGGARSPVAYVLLCPSCAGYAPTVPEDYRGALSGACWGCAAWSRELHRFPAVIDSVSGCRCRGEHPAVTGGLSADGTPGYPQAGYASAWRELASYVQQAVDDGGTIDPAGMLAYLAELKREAMKPVREWMAALTAGGEP
jgi:hypothetical protein